MRRSSPSLPSIIWPVADQNPLLPSIVGLTLPCKFCRFPNASSGSRFGRSVQPSPDLTFAGSAPVCRVHRLASCIQHGFKSGWLPFDDDEEAETCGSSRDIGLPKRMRGCRRRCAHEPILWVCGCTIVSQEDGRLIVNSGSVVHSLSGAGTEPPRILLPLLLPNYQSVLKTILLPNY